MFERISRTCALRDNKLSLWVDDIAVSGDDVCSSLVYEIKCAIRSKGLNYHKIKKRHTRIGAVITGAHISPRGISLANKTHIKVRDKLRDLEMATDPEDRLRLVQSLIGYTNHALTVYGEQHQTNARLKGRLAWLHKVRRELEKQTGESVASATRPDVKHVDTELPPWQM